MGVNNEDIDDKGDEQRNGNENEGVSMYGAMRAGEKRARLTIPIVV